MLTFGKIEEMFEDFHRISPRVESKDFIFHIENSKKSIQLVVPSLPRYSTKKFLDALDHAAEKYELNFEAITHIDAVSEEEATEKFRFQNSRLLEIIEKLSESKIFWSGKIPRFPFAIVDEAVELYASEEGQPKSILYKKGTSTYHEYERHFIAMKNHPLVHELYFRSQ